ncbi:MAG: hypothetical protein ACI8PZ_005552, partial [Myxococcota bacterium]
RSASNSEGRDTEQATLHGIGHGSSEAASAARCRTTRLSV